MGFGSSSTTTTNSSVLFLFCMYITVLPTWEAANWFTYETDCWCWHVTSNIRAFFFSPEIPTWQHKILPLHHGKSIWSPFPLHFTELHWRWRHIWDSYNLVVGNMKEQYFYVLNGNFIFIMCSFYLPRPTFFSSLPLSSICCCSNSVGVFLLVSDVNSLVMRYDSIRSWSWWNFSWSQ